MLPASLGCFSNVLVIQLWNKCFLPLLFQNKSILRWQGKLLSKDWNKTATKHAISHWRKTAFSLTAKTKCIDYVTWWRETATVMRASHFLFLFAFSYSLEHFPRSHQSCFMCYRLCLAQGGWFGLYPLGRKDVLFLICTAVWSGLAGSLIPVLAGRPDAEQRNIWKYKIHLFG